MSLINYTNDMMNNEICSSYFDMCNNLDESYNIMNHNNSTNRSNNNIANKKIEDENENT
ncbi:hypothetical protein PFDG_05216 [Plasmodium falciparum Dd2]|uniref:Uncharacterized protein n=1 Tax=Plasmodium falciparum (isolate Dd2) TaxID=57267 RepID=A0A0L7M9Y2_PLAF4|nr:hypothetical protein PFDG_05216 [Plasmodium falciparum Dd2]